jgi:hypothetical protein
MEMFLFCMFALAVMIFVDGQHSSMKRQVRLQARRLASQTDQRPRRHR